MKNRIGRIIVAVVFLIGFGFYAYKQEQLRYHSADLESWGEAVELHPETIAEGVDMSAPVEYVEEDAGENAEET